MNFQACTENLLADAIPRAKREQNINYKKVENHDQKSTVFITDVTGVAVFAG